MARAALDIGVRDLAICADVSPNTIARLERGESLHRRTLAHIRGALEAQGIIFVSGSPAGIWPGPIVGYAEGRPLSRQAKLLLTLWNLPNLMLKEAEAWGLLLDIYEQYLDILHAEGREPDTWERVDFNDAANYLDRSDVWSARACIQRGITPPDNQSKEYPLGADRVAIVTDCDMAYFRKVVGYLRSKGYAERYPQKAIKLNIPG
jgi:transcriptional regulator with XRE-family HTH domain